MHGGNNKNVRVWHKSAKYYIGVNIYCRLFYYSPSPHNKIIDTIERPPVVPELKIPPSLPPLPPCK